MKLSLALLLAPLAATALPLDSKLDSGLAVRQSSTSIDQLIKNKGKKYIGVATDRGLLQRDKNLAIIKANFGQVTPENSMKWQSLNPSQGTYNWGDADYLVNMAQQNGKIVRGHTLIWHSQLPSWVANINNANTLRQVIKDHVTTVVKRYKGKIAQWDVVNEIFNEDGTLRSSVFSRLLGEEFVSIAFKAAREADPSCKLYINDYNLDRANYGKVNGMKSHVDKWISAGVPIDGIGSQTHLDAGAGSAVQAALQQLASSKASEVAITELDIANAPAADYDAVIKACLNTKKCVGVTVWGISDKDSWRQGKNPLLFDSSFNPKSAYNSVATVLR